MTNSFIVISCQSTYHLQEEQMAALRSDSQREIVSFIYLSHSDLSNGILIERAIRFITP